jgi:hypothetical protein
MAPHAPGGMEPVGNPRDKGKSPFSHLATKADKIAINIGPFKPSRPGYGPVLSYLQAAQLQTPLKIHPLLQLRTWDPKPYAKYLAWNTIEVSVAVMRE